MKWKAKVNSIMNAFIHKEFNGMRYKMCIITAPNWIILKLQQIILQSITWSEQTYNQIRGTHHTLGWPIRAQQHRKTRLYSRTEGNKPSRSCSSQSGFCGWQLRDVDVKPPANPYSPKSPNRWYKSCCPLLGRKPVKKYLFILSPNPTLHFSRHSCSCKVCHPSSFDPPLHRLKEPISRVQWIVILVNLTHQPIHSITTEWTYLNTSLPSLTDWRHGRSAIHTATFSYHSERTRWHWKNSRLQSPGIGEKGDYTIQRSNSLKRIDILAEWIGVLGSFQSGSNRRFDCSLCHSRHLSSHRWNSKFQSSHSPTHAIHPAQTREHFQSNHLLSQWLRGSVW